MPNKYIKLKLTLTLIILAFVGINFHSFAQTQEQLNTFNKERLILQKKAMVALGTWSLGNIAYSTVGTINNEGVNKEFHNMNILWNTINLALAVPGYIGARKGKYDLSLRKTYKAQSSAEKTFLFNAGLDVAYMAGGFYLTEKSKTATTKEKHDRNLGYGNSIILQGGFLLLLDFTMYTIHSRHGNKKLVPFLDNITIGANGVGLIKRF